MNDDRHVPTAALDTDEQAYSDFLASDRRDLDALLVELKATEVLRRRYGRELARLDQRLARGRMRALVLCRLALNNGIPASEVALVVYRVLADRSFRGPRSNGA